MSELLNQISMYLKMEDILNSENMIPIENVKELIDELQKKESIINEAKEYIENKVISNGEVIDQLRKIEVKELLEILDKGE